MILAHNSKHDYPIHESEQERQTVLNVASVCKRKNIQTYVSNSL